MAHRRHQINHTALAILAVNQANIDRAINLAGCKAAIDRRHRIANLGHRSQQGIDLLGTGFGDIKRRSDRGVKIDLRFRHVGLGRELFADAGQEEETQHQSQQGNAQSRQLVPQ